MSKIRIHPNLLRILSVMLCVLAYSAPAAAVEPIASNVVCQDYGGWPEVGGSRVCVTDNGYICRFKSVSNGVEGGCTQG